MPKVRNPNTGRYITVGGRLYNSLKKEGVRFGRPIRSSEVSSAKKKGRKKVAQTPQPSRSPQPSRRLRSPPLIISSARGHHLQDSSQKSILKKRHRVSFVLTPSQSRKKAIYRDVSSIPSQ
jgi:hypothetical protein